MLTLMTIVNKIRKLSAANSLFWRKDDISIEPGYSKLNWDVLYLQHITKLKKKLVLLSVYSPVTLCVFVYKVIFAIFFDTKKHLNLQTVHHCVKIEIILILHKKKKSKSYLNCRIQRVWRGFLARKFVKQKREDELIFIGMVKKIPKKYFIFKTTFKTYSKCLQIGGLYILKDFSLVLMKWKVDMTNKMQFQ